MAKWHGKVGYASMVETAPGIWGFGSEITERPYFGDTIKNNSRWVPSQSSTNDNVVLSTQISIVADPFAYQNFSSIKYVEYMGSMWEVTNADASQRPRILLTLGEVYNGEQARIADEA